MGRLKPQSFREIKRRLEAVGFVEASQKGSHVKFVRRSGEVVDTAIVPIKNELRAMIDFIAYPELTPRTPLDVLPPAGPAVRSPQAAGISRAKPLASWKCRVGVGFFGESDISFANRISRLGRKCRECQVSLRMRETPGT